jgi:exodeoxyribonuclease VII large subunit
MCRGWEELDERLANAAGTLVESVEQLLMDRARSLEELVRHRAFELVRSRLAETGHRLVRSLLRAESGLRRRVRETAVRLDPLRERLARQRPAERIVRGQSRLGRLGDRLGHAAQARAERARVSLDRASVRLDALSPLASLARGYAVCRKPDGTVVSSRRQAKAGERLDVRVSDGTIGCEVTETAPLDETGEARR